MSRNRIIVSLACACAQLFLSSCEILDRKQEAVAAIDHRLLRQLSDDESFFPIGVWFQSIARHRQYKAIGVNILVGANGTPTAADLAALAAENMYIVPERVGGFPVEAAGPTVIAWASPDEPDNAQPRAGGGYDPCISAAEIVRRNARLKAADGRPIFINFGQGVAQPNWPGRGSCTGSDETYYPEAIKGGDIVAFDIYPVAGAGGRLNLVAEGVRNLVRWSRMSDPRRPVWNFIEAAPIRGGAVPATDQVRAQVWLSIINGSRGIVYFPWRIGEKGQRLREDDLFRHPELVEGIARINREVQSLAPFLKKGLPSADIAVSVDAAASTLALRRGQDQLVLIASEAQRPTMATISLARMPDRVETADGQVVPVGPGRRVTVPLKPFGVAIFRLRFAS